jgi:peptide/nickel transport system permease protein
VSLLSSPELDVSPSPGATPATAHRGSWLSAGVAVVRRLMILAALLLVISFGIFSLLGAAPGSPVDALLGAGGNPSPEQIQALKEKYDLDKPFLTRYGLWLGKAVRLQFGDSVQSAQPVTQIIGQRLGVTGLLIAYSALIAVIGGIALGILAALKRGTALDRALTMLGLTGVSIPAFATSLVLLYLLSVLVPMFPSSGEGIGLADRLWHLTLPALALSFTTLGYVMRLTRTSMIHVLGRDYVIFARARGLRQRTVLGRYALRNALVPVMTAAALVFTSFLTSTVLVEVTFNITGIGTLLVTAVQTQDIPVVQGVAMTIAVAVLLTNVVIDASYALVDPRIRQSRGA